MSAQPPSANRRLKLPGGAKPKPNIGPVSVPQQLLDHIKIDDFIVGPDGIQCSDPKWVAPTVRLDDLNKVGRLGSGKQGDVYKYDRKDNPNVKYALKIIRLPGAEAGDISNIVKELKSALMHRVANTVTLENAYVKDGKLILIMEYMNYGNVRELIEQVKATGVSMSSEGIPALPEPVVAWISSQVLSALADMNAGFNASVIGCNGDADCEKERRRAHIHRDIKPENILLTRDGNVKLADFGVATSADSIGASTFTGTVSYMSPERIKGMRHGPSSDVWSVGVVAAESLMGRFPYASVETGIFNLMKEISTTHVELPQGFSPESQEFIDHCLTQDAEQRGTAVDLVNHPWVALGLQQKDALKQLIKKCISKSKPAPPSAAATVAAPL